MTDLTRRSALVLTGLAAVGGLAACGGGDDPLATSTSESEGGGGGGDAIVVGSADFSESTLLAEIYAGALTAKGIDASTKTGIGAREVYLKALEEGSVHVMPEYTGALALYYDGEFDETEAEATYEGLKEVLPDDLVVLEKSEAEDVDCIVVSKDTAEQHDLTSIADLKDVAGELGLAAPPEFKTRRQGIPGLEEVYDVVFGTVRTLKPGQATVQALKTGQVDAANIFSTDPAIPANDFVVLEDPEKLFGSQNIVPLVRTDVEDQVTEVLNAVSEKLTTEVVAGLLEQTDIDKKDPADVAQEFLSDNGLA